MIPQELKELVERLNGLTVSATPGPWIVYKSEYSAWLVYAPGGIKNACPEGQLVANCGVTSLPATREELNANASLVAAANPETIQTIYRGVCELIEQVDKLQGTVVTQAIQIVAAREMAGFYFEDGQGVGVALEYLSKYHPKEEPERHPNCNYYAIRTCNKCGWVKK